MVIVFAAAPVIVDTMFYHASGKTEDPQEKKIHRSGGPTSRMFSWSIEINLWVEWFQMDDPGQVEAWTTVADTYY